MALDPTPPESDPELFSQPGSPYTPEDLEVMKKFAEDFEKIDWTKPLKPSGPPSPEVAEFLRQNPEFALGAPGFAGDDPLLSGDGVDLLEPTTTNEENDMGFFDRFKICLCSEVTGVLTKDGQPVVGAEIVRRLELFSPYQEVKEDRTHTDAQGRFSFKPVYSRHRKPLLAESCIKQALVVIHDGKTYLGWKNSRSGRDLHEDIEGSYPNQKEYPHHNGFYHPLDFDGDLSRATPLPEGEPYDPEKYYGDGFFNHQRVCVASWFRFLLTMNGEPVVGATVTRTAEYVGHRTYVQSKPSPYDGDVELKAIYAPRLAHPWEKIEIRQKIVVEYEGKEYLAWEKTKTNPWHWGEVNPDAREYTMRLTVVSAELTDPVITRGVKTSGQKTRNHLPDDAFPYKGFLEVHRQFS